MRRLFANGNRGQEVDGDTFEEAMSHILRRSASAGPLPVNPKVDREKRKQPPTKKIMPSSLGFEPMQTSYQDAVLGPAPVLAKKNSKDINLNLSLTLSKPNKARIRRFFRVHRIGIVRFSIVASCAVLLFAGVSIIRSVTHKDEGQVAGAAYIAPKTVFLPKNAPEGFTVGSSKQELENGAILYTIYGPRGEEITINQQSSAPDFDQSILKGGLKFTTDYGTAYVLQDGHRITGYLLAEDSWVLLNTTDDLMPEDMRALIRSLEPI